MPQQLRHQLPRFPHPLYPFLSAQVDIRHYGRTRAASVVSNAPSPARGPKTRVMATFLVKRNGRRAPMLVWTNGTGWVL